MDSDDDEDAIVALATHRHMTTLRLLHLRVLRSRIYRRHRGSIPGRRGNKRRDFSDAVRRIREHYFGLDGQEPVYDEKDFERRFRVPRIVFSRIYNAIKTEPWWQQRPNATGRP